MSATLGQQISVIIPALDEADCIVSCLESVCAQAPPFEAIVSDGGSTDGTPSLAQQYARTVESARGRGRQMNAGARRASGEILLFLHADTRLPAGALSAIRRAMADPSVAGGCFRLRFDARGRAYRFYEACTRVRWHRMCLGDRAVFVRRSIFEEIGGYADVPILEDAAFARSIHRRGRICFLSLAVTTSARRFEQHGRIRQQFRNVAIWTAFNLGVPARFLARFYQHEPAASRVTACDAGSPGTAADRFEGLPLRRLASDPEDAPRDPAHKSSRHQRVHPERYVASGNEYIHIGGDQKT